MGKEDRVYSSVEELIAQANSGIGIPFGVLDKTGRIEKISNKGKLGQIIEEALFDIKINDRAESDIPNLGIELKTTPYKRLKNGSISAKERLVLCIINYMTENWDNFYETHVWDKCQKMLLLFYDGTLDGRFPKDYTLSSNYMFKWIDEDMPTILDDFNRISNKVKKGQAELLSESDGRYLSTCTKGQGHGKDMRNQPYSDKVAPQRAWELKPAYMTYILRNYVFNKNEIESIIKNAQNKPFTEIIKEQIESFKGLDKETLFKKFDVNPKSKQANNTLIRKILGINTDVDKTAEFQKANMNLRVIQIKHNGMPKEDSPFKQFEFKNMVTESWEDSQMKNEICDKMFMYVFFKASDSNNTKYCLDKVLFWGFPESLIPEAKRVWKETIEIIKNGVVLTEYKNTVQTNFPTSKTNNVVFTKIHAKNTLYEIQKDKFVGKGNLSDTSQLPDGRHITKHSFWFPKKFVKRIYDENI